MLVRSAIAKLRVHDKDISSNAARSFWSAIVERDEKKAARLCEDQPGLMLEMVRLETSFLTLHPRIIKDLAQMHVREVTALALCVLREDADMCSMLLGLGAHPDGGNHSAMPPLHVCAYTGSERVCNLLLASGADPKIMFRGLLPLHTSVICGKGRVASILMNARPETANAQAFDRDGGTPFILACQYGHADIVRDLMDTRVADPEIPDAQGKTALHHALENRNFVLAIQLLIHQQQQHKFKPPRTTPLGETALHLAAENGASVQTCRDIAHLMAALVGVAAAFASTSTSASRSHKQARKVEDEMKEEKLERDCRGTGTETRTGTETSLTIGIGISEGLNTRTRSGRNVLSYAARGGGVELCAWVLDCGGTYQTDERGMTPMHIAASRKDGGGALVCAELVARGFPLGSRDRMGRTPLFTAVAHGSSETCVVFLNHGADVDEACSVTGTTPLMKAVQLQNAVVVRILLNRGADPNQRNSSGVAPIHRAVADDQMEIVKYLITRGAQLNGLTHDGLTPLDLIKSAHMRAFLESAWLEMTSKKMR